MNNQECRAMAEDIIDRLHRIAGGTPQGWATAMTGLVWAAASILVQMSNTNEARDIFVRQLDDMIAMTGKAGGPVAGHA